MPQREPIAADHHSKADEASGHETAHHADECREEASEHSFVCVCATRFGAHAGGNTHVCEAERPIDPSTPHPRG